MPTARLDTQTDWAVKVPPATCAAAPAHIKMEVDEQPRSTAHSVASAAAAAVPTVVVTAAPADSGEIIAAASVSTAGLLSVVATDGGMSSAMTSDVDTDTDAEPRAIGRARPASMVNHPEYAFAAALLQGISQHHGTTDSETDYSTQFESGTDYDTGNESDATVASTRSASYATAVPRALKMETAATEDESNAESEVENGNSVEPPLAKKVRRPRASKAAKKAKDKKGSGSGDDSKRPIQCSCGRIFSNGQALGGHRGKCKVPRERMRQARDGIDGTDSAAEDSSGGGGGGASAGAGLVAAAPTSSLRQREKKPKKPLTKPPTSAQAVKHFARMGNRKRGRPRKGKVPGKPRPIKVGSNVPQAFVRPVYPITRFDPSDFKIGKNEKSPQTPACIVKIHPYRFDPDDLVDVFTIYNPTDEARRRYKPAKLDDMITDVKLNGGAGAPKDLPETDPCCAVLMSRDKREVPRKLAFIGPDGPPGPGDKKAGGGRGGWAGDRPANSAIRKSNNARATRSSTPTLPEGQAPVAAYEEVDTKPFWTGLKY